jgi:hypothetical protein
MQDTIHCTVGEGNRDMRQTRDKCNSFRSFPMLNNAYWLDIILGNLLITNYMHASGLGLQITRYYSALGKPVPV